MLTKQENPAVKSNPEESKSQIQSQHSNNSRLKLGKKMQNPIAENLYESKKETLHESKWESQSHQVESSDCVLGP